MKVYEVQIGIQVKALQSYKVEAESEAEAKEKALDRVREEYSYDLSSTDLYSADVIVIRAA